MIIYNKDFDLSLNEYGIEVPILDDRSRRCFEELQKLDSSLSEISLDELDEISKEDLLRVHTEEFINELLSNKEKKITDCYELVDEQGNYRRYNPENAIHPLSLLVDKFLLQTQGTYFTLKKAFETKFAFGLCGGMHHAMSDRSRGFCLINDIVISARKFQHDIKPVNISVVDIDAHKGCGTSELTEHDQSIETLSIHMKSGWPLSADCGEGPWRIPSNIDIEIDTDEEDQYLLKLEEGLKKLTNLDLVIIVAGADPYSEDVLESANGIQLSKEQMLERDLLVYRFFKERNIPQAWVMAGGYGPKTWEVYFQFLKLFHGEEHA